MQAFEGRCHCGNAQFRFDWPAPVTALPVRACGCDYCSMHGARWTSHADARCALTIEDDAQILRYRFGTGTADFIVCTGCGVLIAAVCEVDGHARAVINANTLEHIPLTVLDTAPTDFEGEAVDARLARRLRNWMPIEVMSEMTGEMTSP